MCIIITSDNEFGRDIGECGFKPSEIACRNATELSASVSSIRTFLGTILAREAQNSPEAEMAASDWLQF
jgi:hypothetical protein